ncbi:hypothetical protein [Melissospora conviva]|uniref:hypothetical protein n=1 Tax=Melissospora conviva TaxID=3388432 RepID=UPI003C19F1CD
MGACNLPHTLIHVVLAHAEAGLILLADDGRVLVPEATAAGIGGQWAAYEQTVRFLHAGGWLDLSVIRELDGCCLVPTDAGRGVLNREAAAPSGVAR